MSKLSGEKLPEIYFSILSKIIPGNKNSGKSWCNISYFLSHFQVLMHTYTYILYTNLIIQTGPSLRLLTINALCYRWLQLI